MSNLLSSALLRRSFILDRFSQWNPPPLFFIFFLPTGCCDQSKDAAGDFQAAWF